MAYVTDNAIPKAENHYVCWIDIMGTKSKMENSVNTCAIFIFKLHTAILEAVQKECKIKVYPVMDGAYLTAQSTQELQKALFYIFSDLANSFISESENYHRFLIRASVAYGPVIHGDSVATNISNSLSSNENYKNSLLLGLPMIQAYTSEQKAPPFGVLIHESARVFHPESEEPFRFKWWKWWKCPSILENGQSNIKADELYGAIKSYFQHCEQHSMELDYSIDKIKIHRQAADEYFIDEKKSEQT